MMKPIRPSLPVLSKLKGSPLEGARQALPPLIHSDREQTAGFNRVISFKIGPKYSQLAVDIDMVGPSGIIDVYPFEENEYEDLPDTLLNPDEEGCFYTTWNGRVDNSDDESEPVEPGDYKVVVYYRPKDEILKRNEVDIPQRPP